MLLDTAIRSMITAMMKRNILERAFSNAGHQSAAVKSGCLFNKLRQMIIGIHPVRWMVAGLALLASPGWSDQPTFVERDLASVAVEAQKEAVPIVLVFTAPYCTFCEILKEEIIHPGLIGGHYSGRARLAELDLGSFLDVTDFNNERVTPDALASRYGVDITPTLLFLNDRGEEIADRMVGIGNHEFASAYLDRGIEQARSALQTAQ